MSQWKCYVDDSHFRQGARIAIVREHDDGSVEFVQPFTLTTIPPGEQFPTEGTVQLRDALPFLRAMLNAAWEHGLRPDGFNDTRESMKATSAHLQDMRAIAFHKIGAPKP